MKSVRKGMINTRVIIQFFFCKIADVCDGTISCGKERVSRQESYVCTRTNDSVSGE